MLDPQFTEKLILNYVKRARRINFKGEFLDNPGERASALLIRKSWVFADESELASYTDYTTR